MVTCTAFFYISAIGNMNRGDEVGEKRGAEMKAAGDLLMQVAGRIGTLIDQKPEAIGARLNMALAGMRTEIGDKFVNYSILLSKYLQPCTDLSGNMAGRVKAILERR